MSMPCWDTSCNVCIITRGDILYPDTRVRMPRKKTKTQMLQSRGKNSYVYYKPWISHCEKNPHVQNNAILKKINKMKHLNDTNKINTFLNSVPIDISLSRKAKCHVLKAPMTSSLNVDVTLQARRETAKKNAKSAISCTFKGPSSLIGSSTHFCSRG